MYVYISISKYFLILILIFNIKGKLGKYVKHSETE